VAFSPDGKILASGSWDKTIKLWDVSSGKELRTLTGHLDRVHSIAFSPDGSSSWDNSIKLWDASTGRELRTLRPQLPHLGSKPHSLGRVLIINKPLAVGDFDQPSAKHSE
jgi:WD40 repeat protein